MWMRGLLSEKTFVLMAFLLLPFDTLILAAEPNREGRSELERLTALEAKIDNLDKRLDSELRAADMRVQGLTESSDRAFNLVYMFGAVGSFLGGGALVLSWTQRRQSHKDYEHERRFYEERVLQNRTDYEQERKFYETRVLDLEQRQHVSQDHTLDLSQKSADREASFAQQQLDLGSKFLLKSDDLLSKQIDSIEKLGGVIQVVRDTFELQLEREREQKDIQREVSQANRLIAGLVEDSEKRYEEVCEVILEFKAHSRMRWTRLVKQEEVILSRARTSFETIFRSVLDERRKDKPHKFALVHQLLGVSAYYANDVDAATKYLEAAHEMYAEMGDGRPEDLYPRAFCSHFLGLIEKNWRHVERPVEANLTAAIHHLEEANLLLKDSPDEFLTPLTLAEVLSYLEHGRTQARALIDDKISQFQQLRRSPKGLNDNQRTLLGRAYLLRGNLDFINGDFDAAREYYEKADKEDKQRHFAWLSIALATDPKSTTKRRNWFDKGLQSLEGSGALKKRETVVRVMVLAWALMASHEIGDKAREERYLQEFKDAESDACIVGRREPLFFCPLTKQQVNFKQLNDNIMQRLR